MRLLFLGIIAVFVLAGCLTNFDNKGCPIRGWQHTDVGYCTELCMVNKVDSGVNQDLCDRMCNQADYIGGSPAVEKRIQSYRCSKCGDCTSTQQEEITGQSETEQVPNQSVNSNANNQVNNDSVLQNYPGNLALRKSAFSSINPETAGGAVDEDITTFDDNYRFATRSSEYVGAWWKVDLETVQKVGRIVIYANPGSTWSDFPSQWHLDYSSDGQEWTRLITESASPAKIPIEYNFSQVNARYLMITADASNQNYWWYMQEFQVFKE